MFFPSPPYSLPDMFFVLFYTGPSKWKWFLRWVYRVQVWPKQVERGESKTYSSNDIVLKYMFVSFCSLICHNLKLKWQGKDRCFWPNLSCPRNTQTEQNQMELFFFLYRFTQCYSEDLNYLLGFIFCKNSLLVKRSKQYHFSIFSCITS